MGSDTDKYIRIRAQLEKAKSINFYYKTPLKERMSVKKYSKIARDRNRDRRKMAKMFQIMTLGELAKTAQSSHI